MNIIRGDIINNKEKPLQIPTEVHWRTDNVFHQDHKTKRCPNNVHENKITYFKQNMQQKDVPTTHNVTKVRVVHFTHPTWQSKKKKKNPPTVHRRIRSYISPTPRNRKSPEQCTGQQGSNEFYPDIEPERVGTCVR